MTKTRIELARTLFVLAGLAVAACAQGASLPVAPPVTPPVATQSNQLTQRVAAPAQEAAAEANAFNRLHTPPAQRNLPPAEDGIHDPQGAGTPMLQVPLAAFGALPKSNSGNRVNWASAVESGKINPLWSATDPQAKAQVLDLNIVREVKGSMPDVVFSHKRHTIVQDCTGCHPALFVPQKGSNKMSMASIMLGESCGACHGRVAFPVSECRLCHSKAKAFVGAGGSR